MTTRYLDPGDFMSWAGDEVIADEPIVVAAINSAENDIDTALGRRMIVAAGSATARSYAPKVPNTSVLMIDDAATITSVVENGVTLVAGVDYRAEPTNGVNAAGDPVPYHRLVRLGAHWHYSTDHTLTVVVTATWGWSAIPALVVDACRVLTRDSLANRHTRFGLAGITEAGGVGVRENDLVTKMKSRYGRSRRFGIA